MITNSAMLGNTTDASRSLPREEYTMKVTAEQTMGAKPNWKMLAECATMKPLNHLSSTFRAASSVLKKDSSHPNLDTQSHTYIQAHRHRHRQTQTHSYTQD